MYLFIVIAGIVPIRDWPNILKISVGLQLTVRPNGIDIVSLNWFEGSTKRDSMSNDTTGKSHWRLVQRVRITASYRIKTFGVNEIVA